MKLYKIKKGIIIEQAKDFYLLENESWDLFINDDNLFSKTMKIVLSEKRIKVTPDIIKNNLEAPIQNQELWASGVTYYNSKMGRLEESRDTSGGEFYNRVYQAERPELFFKATSYRIAGPDQQVKIRKDSVWNVPEPELTLMITSGGKIVGYTIGNDITSRSIERENPLYLPQAKIFDGCASIGPCIYVTEEPLPADTVVWMEIIRKNVRIFEGSVEVGQMKRKQEDLVSYLYRECSFPHGSLLMTGTGIIPPNDFSLQSGDKILITIHPIGTLVNSVN